MREGRNGAGEGRGGALDMGSAPPPPEASSGSAPAGAAPAHIARRCTLT